MLGLREVAGREALGTLHTVACNLASQLFSDASDACAWQDMVEDTTEVKSQVCLFPVKTFELALEAQGK